MPVTWDETKERQFLLTIIHAQGATAPPNWNTVQGLMGEEYTANGLRQKFDKLKKAAKDQFGEMKAVEGGEDVATTTPKKTPAKRGKKAGGETKSTGKRKSAAKVTAGSDGEEDVKPDPDEETPTKKVKTEVAEEGEDKDELR